MDSASKIEHLNQIKALSDENRMIILRQLMAKPATLTQLANWLHHSPAWIRHHLLALEEAGLVELVEIRKRGRVTEKYYRANAAAYLIQQWVLPKSDKPVLIFCGSHDLALERLAKMVSKHLQLVILAVGSLNGLINLRQGVCQMAGAHIFDSYSREYNIPTLNHLFPDRSLRVITLAQRVQGLIVATGNPKGVCGIEDLIRPDIRIVNRNEGSGTRLWFDAELKRLGIAAPNISGYDRQLYTHIQIARSIQDGVADAALGLQAAADQYGLGFIPLFEERYDLVFPNESQNILYPILDFLASSQFRRQSHTLSGYNLAHSGEEIKL
ncbi:MAG: substrate-binding domain-containing protein [Anaerolineales bacterium]